MPKHSDKAELVGLLGQNDPVFFFNFRRSLRGIVLTTPLIYLNPYSGNRRLIALRTFSAVNCPVTEKIAQIAQKFLTGHFTNEEPNSLVNPRRRPWAKKLTQRSLQNQPELPMKSVDDQDPNRLTIGIRTIWRPVSANHCRKWAISKWLGQFTKGKSATAINLRLPEHLFDVGIGIERRDKLDTRGFTNEIAFLVSLVKPRETEFERFQNG